MSMWRSIRAAKLDRWPYFGICLWLIFVKYNFDRVWIGYLYGLYWIWPAYWGATAQLQHFDQQKLVEIHWYILLTGLPFLILGIVLTMGRLQSAALTLWLLPLMLVPYINFVLFVVLSVIPPASDGGTAAGVQRWQDRWMPNKTVASALGAMLLTSAGVGLICFLVAALGAHFLEIYGGVLFASLPFVTGMLTVIIYPGREPRTVWHHLGLPLLPLAVIGAAFLFTALEGIICLAMAVPIAVPLAWVGGAAGHAIVGRRGQRGVPPGSIVLIFLSMPVLMGMEHLADLEPPVFTSNRSIIIQAPPERVWPVVVAFSVISADQPRHWLLRTGIAYPLSSEIVGTGVGAIRYCNFTTGRFVEPITLWQENRCLEFTVTEQPPPMEEISPYGHIKPAHLHGYFNPQRGRIDLIPLPDGTTRLECTTWYTNRMWPAAYWKQWTDNIITQVHRRVLEHVKRETEAKERGAQIR